MRLSLDLLQRKIPASYSDSIKDAIHLVNQSIDHIRDLAMELRPSLLDHLGLEAALRWNVDHIRAHTEVKLTFESINDGPRFQSSIEAACFRIFQEALTNAVRHASAHSIHVFHENSANSLRVQVEDDGEGFEKGSKVSSSSLTTGLGLLGMRERAEDNGGELTIESQPGHGTKVQVVFHRSKVTEANEVGAA